MVGDVRHALRPLKAKGGEVGVEVGRKEEEKTRAPSIYLSLSLSLSA